MKSFLILLGERQPHLLNDKLLEDHINYLKKLRVDGHLLVCGPFLDNQGAMLVIKANSEAEAMDLIKNDPFITGDYYKKFVMNEFTEVGAENDWVANSKQTIDNLEKQNNTNILISHDPKEIKKKAPLTISLLFRRLKEDKTYTNFRDAWLPPIEDISQYFNMPILVINAENVQDPAEIISVALIWADVEEATKGYQHYQATENIRHKKIEKTTNQSAETRFCKILDIDVLGS
jgi:uncharacterized protein